MSNQSSIYNEKKLATYEGAFKLNAFAKQQDVNMTLTAEHIYGLAYIVEQTGTIEGDPVYTRFSCSFDEVTKVYTGENQKQTALYIQCDKMTKGTLVRRRVVVPGLKNPEEAANQIKDLKEKFDEKHNRPKESSRRPDVTSSALNSGNPSIANAAAEVTKAAAAAVEAVNADNAAQQNAKDNSKNIKDLSGDIKKGFGSVKKRVENINPKELFAKATKSKAILRAPVSVEITEKSDMVNAEKAPAFTGSVVDSDDFFNNIPVPKKNAPASDSAEEKTEASAEEAKAVEEVKTAEETAAAEEAKTAVEAKAPEESSVEEGKAYEAAGAPEEAKAAEGSEAPAPEISSAAPEVTEALTEEVPEAPAPAAEDVSEPAPEEAAEAPAETAARPKVTIEDLMKLNDSIDDDFLKNTEPPITGGKENADRYLESIGGDYIPAAKPVEAEDDYIEPVAESIVLEDINDFTSAGSSLPEIDELPDVIDASKLISDMTGGAVDITNETTPVERMDFIPKSHRKAVAEAKAAAAEEIPSITKLDTIEEIPSLNTDITETAAPGAVEAEPEAAAVPEVEEAFGPETVTVPEVGEAIEPETVTVPEVGEAIEPEAAAVPEAGEAIEPEAAAVPEAGETAEPEAEIVPEPDAVNEPDITAEIIAEPQQIAAEDAYISDETVAESPVEEPVQETTEPAPEVTSVHIDFSTEVTNDTSLEDFEERVKKLKSMLDSGLISKEEFTVEKKKLLETLY